ncbi:hypothetical protein [Sediminibacillus albus]|uniref:hypothetical protein n=1 Tax=Sediminibacillus albus TaxID=407036 RepID=UPI000B82C60F|nr:hypothetical protein [Sediminibacillus albus]
MFIELLNEVLNEASPFYFYVGFFLAAYCAFSFSFMSMPLRAKSKEAVTRNYYATRFRLLPIETRLGEIAEILDWITEKSKRKEGPEDDSDNHFLSFTKQNQKRGGEQWTNILYSHSLKNIALSSSFY